MFTVLLLALGFATALLIPSVGAVLCAAVLVVQTSIMILRLVSSKNDAPRSSGPAHGSHPVFSVHVATHNEPPAMVARTLQALSVQDWPAERFEIIVMDNNTADPALWLPIQDLCTRLGPQVTFLHQMGVRGAKAGALNIALAGTRSDATHIVTVDADYVVQPRFLACAAEALRATGADYVQFPQAYTGSDGIAKAVDAELEEYFRTNARMADGSEAVLLTGTLCVIAKAALVDAGGWSGRTITEDADMGVRLCCKGYGGRFIDRVVGRGYLPMSLRDLERQRHRWASGNLSTLLLHAPALLLGRDAMGWRRRGAIVSQLTAWLNLSLIPAVLLIGSLSLGQGGSVLAPLAAFAILLCFADTVGRLVWRGLRDGAAPGVLIATIGHRLALAPSSALATFSGLIGQRVGFRVTDKSGAVGWLHGVPTISLLLGAAALLALPAAVAGGWLTTTAVLCLMTPFPAALATARTLSRYRTHLLTPMTGAAG